MVGGEEKGATESEGERMEEERKVRGKGRGGSKRSGKGRGRSKRREVEEGDEGAREE